jgi:hypothetical protein
VLTDPPYQAKSSSMRLSSIIVCGQANIEAHYPKNNPGENRGCMKKPKLTTMRISKLFSDF